MLIPYSARGHVNPFLAVAAELIARGHAVTVVAGRRYATAVTDAGASLVGGDTDHDVRVQPGYGVRKGIDRVALSVARRQAWTRMASTCRAVFDSAPPDVVLADPRLRWAGRLGTRWGVTTVPFWTTYARLRRGSGLVLVNAVPELQPRRERFGPHYRFVGPLIGGVRSPDPGLPWERIRRGRTLLVSPGTVNTWERQFFRTLIGELADTEWTVVLAAGQTPLSALGALPGNVIARQWLPQLELLEHADVFVTHAGMNSVQESIVHAVPMVTVPRSREQNRLASLAHRCGVALPWPGQGRLRTTVEHLAEDPAVRSTLRAAQRQAVASAGAAHAADALDGVIIKDMRC